MFSGTGALCWLNCSYLQAALLLLCIWTAHVATASLYVSVQRSSLREGFSHADTLALPLFSSHNVAANTSGHLEIKNTATAEEGRGSYGVEGEEAR